MALDFETLKKIEAGGVNVGMIQNSAGDILWRKKYDKLHIGLAEQYDEDAWKWKSVVEYSANNVVTGTAAANKYFWYNDRVDIFQPVNVSNASLVVSWYENTPQLNNTSLLLPHAIAYTASTAMSFYRPIHAPGILRELGRIEKQNTWYTDASDTIACVSSDITEEHPENTWTGVLERSTNIVNIQNEFPIFQSRTTSTPLSSLSYVMCKVAQTTTGYSFTFTLHAATDNWRFVSFFVVDNMLGTNVRSPRLVTLLPGSRNSQTIESTGLKLDILQVGTYLNSSDSYVNGSKFTGLTSRVTVYLTLTSNSAGKRFYMNTSGEVYNSNTKVASSYSYCNIFFIRPSTRFKGLRITYSQDSESNYDYGVFSNIDNQLCPTHVLDSTTTSGLKKIYTGYGSEVVKHSCKGESGTKTVSYNISHLDTTSRHSICVKYIKDSSDDTGTDTFKITKIEFVEDLDYSFYYSTSDNLYVLTVNNYGSTDAQFEWLYIYIEGSSQDYTLENVDELTGTIPANDTYDFWLTADSIPQQSGRIFCIFKCNGQYHTIYQ